MKVTRKGYYAMALLLMSLSTFAAPVTLTCTLPTLNEDGTPLTDLAGIRFYDAVASGGPYVLVADNPDCTATLDKPPGTWYFVATAYNTAGIESVYSGEASKVVPPSAPASPTNLVVTGNLVAYSISQTKDRLVTYPVGTVPVDTPCDSTMSANGLYLVPTDAVVFAGQAQATVAFAQCGVG